MNVLMVFMISAIKRTALRISRAIRRLHVNRCLATICRELSIQSTNWTLRNVTSVVNSKCDLYRCLREDISLLESSAGKSLLHSISLKPLIVWEILECFYLQSFYCTLCTFSNVQFSTLTIHTISDPSVGFRSSPSNFWNETRHTSELHKREPKVVIPDMDTGFEPSCCPMVQLAMSALRKWCQRLPLALSQEQDTRQLSNLLN